MKQIVCDACAGKELIKQDGVFVCQSCGTKYSAEEIKKMVVEIDASESETKPENSEGTLLTEPLAPGGLGGSGCGCLSVFGNPIFIAISVLLLIIFTVVLDKAQPPEQKEAKARQSEIEDLKIKARVQLEQSIKANLREPKSYQNTATDVWILEEYIFVKNTFRGKNRYGGYEVCTFVAQFNFNTEPAEWDITNKPSSDSGCRAIMIALP